MSILLLSWALLSAAQCTNAAWAASSVYDSGEPGAVSRYLDSAGRAAYHGRYTQALAFEDKALSDSPSSGEAFFTRALTRMTIGLYDQAESDLNKVSAMHPDDMSLAMNQAVLALHRADGLGAMAALRRALVMPLHTAWRHDQFYVTGHMEAYADEYGSIANQLLHRDDAALNDMRNMLKLELQNPEYRLADYCYLAGVAGLLESAALACQSSIDENPHDIGQYDSLGYVHVRMKQWDKAIDDYNKAINDRPDLTTSLYGRGVARRAKGDIAGGNADIAAATRDEPDIANIMHRLGVPQ